MRTNDDVTMELLAQLEAGREWYIDRPMHVWQLSQARARRAYEHWRRNPGAKAYAAYRAAQDQADRAQDELHRPARTT